MRAGKRSFPRGTSRVWGHRGRWRREGRTAGEGPEEATVGGGVQGGGGERSSGRREAEGFGEYGGEGIREEGNTRRPGGCDSDRQGLEGPALRKQQWPQESRVWEGPRPLSIPAQTHGHRGEQGSP